jgi:hypothetical protein
MRRREFILLIGGVAAGCPLATRAQQTATPVVGILSSRSPSESSVLIDSFRKVCANWDRLRVRTSISHLGAPTFCDMSRHTLMLVDLTRPIRSVRHQCRFGHRGKHTTCRPAKNKFPQPGMPIPAHDNEIGIRIGCI